MKKRLLIIGGNSKISRIFIKKFGKSYFVDICLHEKNNIQKIPCKKNVYSLDLSNNNSIKNLINKIDKNKYDGVLLFSGIYKANVEYSLSEFIKVIKVNFLSFVEILKRLKLRNNSKIILFTDEGINQPKRRHFSYSFSKALLENYIRILAIELADTSSVIGLGLGPIVTDKIGQEKKRYYSQSLISVKNPPLGLANFIDFILTEDNFYSTGKVISFDGGAYIKRTS